MRRIMAIVNSIFMKSDMKSDIKSDMLQNASNKKTDINLLEEIKNETHVDDELEAQIQLCCIKTGKVINFEEYNKMC